MAFANEYIPAQDYKKFNFDFLNSRLKEASGTIPADFWTINRGSDIWLRCFYVECDHTAEKGGFTGVSVWDFFWKGELMSVKVQDVEVGGGVGKHCWTRKKILSINVPPNLEDSRKTVMDDLAAAFTAYKDGGVLASCTSFSFTLEV